jgi:hypothetical protein
MKCNHCDKELDFKEMQKRNWRETKKKNLSVYLVVEIWKRQDLGTIAIRYEYILRGIWTEPEIAEGWKDFLESEYEDRFLKNDRPRVYVEETRLNHLYGDSMFKADIIRR